MTRDVRVLPSMPQPKGVLAKAALGMLRKPGEVSSLPDRTYIVAGHRATVSRLAAYCGVTGFALRDTMPATWLHVQTFPLHMQVLAADDFPFPLAGLVHVTNEMTLRRPVRIDEALDVAVRAENLQPHAKGAVFDMVGEIHVGDELVWRGVSNYLAPSATVPGEPGQAVRIEAPSANPSQVWRLPGDLGRQYAAVSGDSNPIHLNPVTSRLFGFPRPIIHGMWTHARALAALGGRLPGAYAVRVQFAKPILLPGKVRFAAAGGNEGWRFAVVNGKGKPHLVGELTTP